jgi:hypothetical protein
MEVESSVGVGSIGVAACKQERFDLQTGKILAQINCKYE